MITKEATRATEADQAVRDVLAATVAAWSANDAHAFAELYAADATVVLPGVFLRGREELRTFMAAGFAGPRKGTRSVDVQESVRIVGDAAVVVSRSGVLLPGEQEVPPERLRRATWTLAKHDGWWLVEAYHNCDM
ncbi:MAG TPA: SgcJ/EcaC family oxidoreductase [Micromonosporaceae bacterium]|nr:SgcJ/EcaC family oxidoreductase [Micromonosporaceae bacterium]